MVHDLQTHALPDQQKELERCAIRMGYDKADRSIAVKEFQADHATHTTLVHDIFRSFFDTPKTSAILVELPIVTMLPSLNGARPST